MKADVCVFADANELSLRVAEAAVRTINESLQTNGSFSLALSGGNTPRTLYRLLSSQFRDQIPWTKAHVFWDCLDAPIARVKAPDIPAIPASPPLEKFYMPSVERSSSPCNGR
jgi:hypothetical protein